MQINYLCDAFATIAWRQQYTAMCIKEFTVHQLLTHAPFNRGSNTEHKRTDAWLATSMRTVK
jgi:hypothetical protein